MEKLRWQIDVFARDTNKSPQRSDRRDKSETAQMTCWKYTGPV